MKNIIEKLQEIEKGNVGIVIYSNLNEEIILSQNGNLSVPLASAAKVVIGFCVACFVEDGQIEWNDQIKVISFNPNEDSRELYPHFQGRRTISLQDAVEVMIACHDSFVANQVVEFCGGWQKINQKVKSYFQHINVTQNPREQQNNGELSSLLKVIQLIFQRYKDKPDIWKPIISGLVRQRSEIEGIPYYHLNHMTGGLDNVVVDIGILGEFSQNPFLYVIGAKDLPNRKTEKTADEKIITAMKLLYSEYLKQETTN